MDPFKRSTLLISQAALGQITSDEIRVEMQTLLPLMESDAESQPAAAAAAGQTTAAPPPPPAY
jgi:hypothetical protein